MRHLSPPSYKSYKLYIIAIVFIVVAILGLLLVINNRIRKQPDLSNVNTIISIVGAIYILPNDETPALATVTDTTKLSSIFAGKVENGDKILIYQNNKKAIVYRPSVNKIADVVPIQIDSVNSK